MRWVQFCNSLNILWHCLYSGLEWKTDLFQSYGHCWVLQICWHIECSALTASSFRIWNSSAGIPSPLLVLLIVMLPKAHLTSHFRMYDSSWFITPSWLSGSLRYFLYSFLYSLVFKNTYVYILNIYSHSHHLFPLSYSRNYSEFSNNNYPNDT